MAEQTAIAWTDHTFNPWWGCTKVSPGCDHCYAETLDRRTGGQHWGPHAARRRTSEKNWHQPLRWNQAAERAGVRRRVFCASMADVFDNAVPAAWRADMWDLIRATPSLDWQLLTKRPQNIEKMLPPDWGLGWSNVWLGTTVENQVEANRRVPILLDVPAAIRFLSCEPLIGPVDLRSIDLVGGHDEVLPLGAGWLGRLEPGEEEGSRIGWVICGGESGAGARPMHPDWARSLRDQCAAAGVPFFFKQWGEWLPGAQYGERHRAADPSDSSRFRCMDWDWDHRAWQAADGEWGCDLSGDEVYRVGKKLAGDQLDGCQHQGFPHA